MRGRAFALLLTASALAVSARAPAAEVVTSPGARIEIDWGAGHIRAVGAGAADIRAPGPEIARIGAERTARQAAAKRLAEAARALPAGDGGTIGQLLDADAAAAARFQAAVGRARDIHINYSSDGSVEVTLALPLEAIRSAVAPPTTPAAAADAPTAIVIDATSVKISPVLGVSLQSDDEIYAGPTIWTNDPSAAAKDPRAGARVVDAKATAWSDKTVSLVIDVKKESLAAARKAGALVVVVIEKDKKPKAKPVK